MPTTSTIGTASRNYSTITAWLAAFTTGGWIGNCYNDSEFVEQASFSGHSTSAANYITLQCAVGQSFKDNANAQTNALSYNVANGVGLRYATAYAYPVLLYEDYVTIQNMQIQQSVSNGRACIDGQQGGNDGPHCLINGCILETLSGGHPVVYTESATYINSLLVIRFGTNHPGVSVSYGNPTFANCTIVRPSDFGSFGTGFNVGGSHFITCTNCGVFGFTGFVTGGSGNTGSNNATDQSTIGFGSANQVSLTYTSQFQNTLNGTIDFRLVSGANLIDTGATDTTDIPAAIDIVGTSRPQSTAWDIGCWELVVAATGFPWFSMTQDANNSTRQIEMIRSGP